MAADPGLSMGQCLENREGGIKRDLRNRGNFVWIPHPTNQLCRLTPETAGEIWIGPGHLGSREWLWIWKADRSIMAEIKHGQCHQSRALTTGPVCGGDWERSRARGPLPCPGWQQGVRGPEGHAECERDDGGVDGPWAIDGHLGRDGGQVLRPLATGTAPATPGRPDLWRLPIS